MKEINEKNMEIRLHKGDLPSDFDAPNGVAVDTETLGLNLKRDRLCLAQVCAGDGIVHLVQFDGQNYEAPNLKKIIADKNILKIFHFARFDVAQLQYHLKINVSPVFCTKIASKLTRTYTNKHGLQDVVQEALGVDLAKDHQSSDWGAPTLSEGQMHYAALDVLYLHGVMKYLAQKLEREGRSALARACFNFLPARAALDLAGFEDGDIFSHHN